MAHKFALALLVAVLSLFAAPDAEAQIAEKDTICVQVVQLQQMRQKVENLRRRDSINTEIKRNLQAQVVELETVVRQDSVITGSLRQELSFRKQQIDLRNKRIDNLQTQLRRNEYRKWVYFVGGAATVVLGAWVSGQAAN